ncbi:MAG TPA: LamG-like jellyroll fold domain-containing protein [Kofleriaceae bacterium]
MVLRLLVILVTLTGCKQSLFDSHGGDDDGSGGGDGSIASSCPAPCLGDGGAAFDGTAMGSDMHWRYLEDHKDRTWAAMTAMGDKQVGAVAGNEVTSCAKHDAPACQQLPGALLISTAGNAGPETAVEWVAPSARVVQLQLGVRLPDGAPTQTVRLYRGSREDALFTAVADPGVTVQQTITLDVLEGERVYVTLDGGNVTYAAVQLFVVGDTATFPSQCQMALAFDAATGTGVHNLCGADLGYHDYDTSMSATPTFGAGPYTEEGMAATLMTSKYYEAPSPLDRTGDFTIQFWMKFNGVVDASTGGWAFSDLDLDNTGGIGVVLFTDQTTTPNHLAIDVQSCNLVTMTTLDFDELTAQYPDDMAWHFVRIVHSGASDVALCVDGMKLGNKAFTKADNSPQPLASTYAPYIGKNVVWTPSEPSFNGSIDDLRILKAALPCN